VVAIGKSVKELLAPMACARLEFITNNTIITGLWTCAICQPLQVYLDPVRLVAIGKSFFGNNL
jgi:hypothetical protein